MVAEQSKKILFVTILFFYYTISISGNILFTLIFLKV